MDELIKKFDLLGYIGLGLGKIVEGINPDLQDACTSCTGSCQTSCEPSCKVSCASGPKG